MRLTDDLKATIPHVRRFSAILAGSSSAFDGYLCDYVSTLNTTKTCASTPVCIRLDMFRAVVQRWRSDGMQIRGEKTATEPQLPTMATPLLQSSPETFAAFILTYVEDFDIEGTAHILGWDQQTTRDALTRAQSTLTNAPAQDAPATAT